MSERRRSPKVRKSESPEEVKAERLKAKSKNTGQFNTIENNSAFDSYRDDIPQSELNKSDPDSYRDEHPKSEIKTMEVHHHPDLHHKKKNWKEYFLEFLMIFLAVTMGFFAETMRENISESGKAKELAKSLYQEVYADSVTIESKIKMRMQKGIQLEYFRRYVADSSLTHLSEKFYPCYVWSFILTNSIMFEPNDGILNQLRNSGTLRYFKGIGLQNSISRFNVAILNVRNRNSQEYTFFDEFVRPFTMKHFDFKWYDAFTQHGKLNINQQLAQTNYHSPIPPRIKDLKDFNREEADGVAGYNLLIIRATVQQPYENYVIANHQVLQELRKEYNFKNE